MVDGRKEGGEGERRDSKVRAGHPWEGRLASRFLPLSSNEHSSHQTTTTGKLSFFFFFLSSFALLSPKGRKTSNRRVESSPPHAIGQLLPSRLSSPPFFPPFLPSLYMLTFLLSVSVV